MQGEGWEWGFRAWERGRAHVPPLYQRSPEREEVISHEEHTECSAAPEQTPCGLIFKGKER